MKGYLDEQGKATIARLWDLGLCGGCIARVMGVSGFTARAYKGWVKPDTVTRYYGDVVIEWTKDEVRRLDEVLNARREGVREAQGV